MVGGDPKKLPPHTVLAAKSKEARLSREVIRTEVEAASLNLARSRQAVEPAADAEGSPARPQKAWEALFDSHLHQEFLGGADELFNLQYHLDL
ncbi:MAG: hypothetical protein Q8P67_00435 [archaeon]|nr:hypothetical protein [archaeon]